MGLHRYWIIQYKRENNKNNKFFLILKKKLKLG